MSNKHTRTPHSDAPELGSAADRPGPADGAGPADRAAMPSGEQSALDGAMAAEVELAMSDLVADRNGEIVFFNDSGVRRLLIATDAAVVADGRSGRHRTAAGEDVSGFSFMTFDNGLTLYYQAGLDVVVRGTP